MFLKTSLHDAGHVQIIDSCLKSVTVLTGLVHLWRHTDQIWFIYYWLSTCPPAHLSTCLSCRRSRQTTVSPSALDQTSSTAGELRFIWTFHQTWSQVSVCLCFYDNRKRALRSKITGKESMASNHGDDSSGSDITPSDWTHLWPDQLLVIDCFMYWSPGQFSSSLLHCNSLKHLKKSLHWSLLFLLSLFQ